MDGEQALLDLGKKNKYFHFQTKSIFSFFKTKLHIERKLHIFC